MEKARITNTHQFKNAKAVQQVVVVQIPLKDWKKIEKTLSILSQKREMISEEEAAILLGKEGKPLKKSRMYALRHSGKIPPSYYSKAVNGSIFYDKNKLIGLE